MKNGNRIIEIDAIRGVSLFGILVVNMLSFHSPHFMYGGKRPFYDSMEAGVVGIDSGALLTIIDIFFQASFYPLFSLLFGIGLWMMYEKREHGEAKKLLIRRLVVLMGIGLLHGIFIWYGDILFTYSIIGLISLLFLNHSTKTILYWTVGLLVIPVALFTLASYEVRDQIEYVFTGQITQSKSAYQGTYSEIFNQNMNDWLVMVDLAQLIFTIVAILPMFLFGIVIARSDILSKPNNHLPTIRRLIFVTFIIFITFKAGPYLFDDREWLTTAQDTIGGSASALFYFFTLLVLLSKIRVSMPVKFLASMGKLSFSNYLMQSMIGFVLFYGVGFGLYSQLALSELMVLAVLIYFIQLIASYLYMKKFTYGPVEWLYRSLTYKKGLKFRK